ncbi:MAG: GNAT family N-acetyltransferase [Oscillospiraceae bacterium]|jgi:ribosomal protein S18 acetylase RimI-like enzyme|nr:GNAT family N-acetyltransferase [Oscillospiraceae bacterium]
MTIKKFTIKDYNAANSLWRKTAGICSCEKCLRYDSREEVTKFLAKNPETCFIAEENGELIGTVLAGNDGRTALIYRLAVDEKYRIRGIGRALVKKAVEALKREGMEAVTLFCLKDNESGNAFWEKIGFTEMTEAITYKLKI